MKDEKLVEVVELMKLVIGFNHKFGTYPTVFASYSGHVNWVDIMVHDKGWNAGREADVAWTVYLDSPLTFAKYTEIKNYLEAIV